MRLLAALLFSISLGQAADDRASVRDARAALDRGDLASAEQELAGLQAHPGDAEAVAILFQLGMAFAKAGQFAKAETCLTRALAANPANFKLLYNAGVAASYAGHPERASEMLETALRQQPRNVDVLYSLAYVDQPLKRWEHAVKLLAQASKLAPQRADIQKLLAISTTELRAYEDAATAWDRYLKLEPNDHLARRERGAAAVRLGQFAQGIADLEWFLARHPDDPAGHYELALAQSEIDPAKGLIHLDRAIELKPDLVAARSARGSLYYRQGRPEAALADLEFAAGLQPDDPLILDRLGQVYLALDRPADALRVLRKAAGLSPGDSRTQLHFARALADAGQEAESKAVMDRFRQLGPANNRVPAGLVEYLSLTPEQRLADYRARVEKAVRDTPSDAAAQLRYLKLLLDDGKPDRAAAVARRIAALKPDASVLADAGHALLEAHQYPLAIEMLEQAGRSAEVELDLAIAIFHTAGAAQGLRQMDRVPESGRTGDYFLARAQMLDAAGRFEDAVPALDQALQAAPKRPDLYRQAVFFLTTHDRAAEALRLLDRAARVLPQNPEILLMKAATLEIARHPGDTDGLLRDIQNRWPEWYPVWVARGAILAARKRSEEARHAMETAVTLGAHSPANQPPDLNALLARPLREW